MRRQQSKMWSYPLIWNLCHIKIFWFSHAHVIQACPSVQSKFWACCCLLCTVAVYWKWKRRQRWCGFLLSLCLIFSSKVHTERCKRGLLAVSWTNQSDGFRRHCSRFTTQLLASLRLLPLLLFPTVKSHTSMACPSMILIASGTVATSVGDEIWWLVMEMKGRRSDPFAEPFPCAAVKWFANQTRLSPWDAARRLFLCTK